MRLPAGCFPFWVEVALLILLASRQTLALQAGVGGSIGRGQPPSSDSIPRYKLKGTVIDAITGEPLNRVLVQIYAQGQRATLTDHEGHFQFDSLPQMQTNVSARKPGFFDQNQQSGGRNYPPTLVRIDQDTAPVVLKLFPEAVLSGHVYDENGEPLAQVPIRIGSFHITNGMKQWQQGGGATTNEDGEFRIANQSRGEYYLSAGPTVDRTLLQVTSTRSQSAYPTVYYPGVAELQGSTPIQLSPGQHLQADFSLQPAPASTVSGMITGYPTGQWVDLRFLSPSGEELSFAKAFNPANGKFEARIVSAGPSTIKARTQDATGILFTGETTLNLVGNTKEVTLSLVPTASIPVTVQQTHVATAASRNYGLTSFGSSSGAPPISIELVGFDRNGARAYMTTEGTTPQTRISQIRNLAPGTYHLVANAFQPWYIQSMTLGTSDLLRESFVLAPGESRALEITLRDDNGSLVGKVNASGGQIHAAVLLIPEQAPLFPKLATPSELGDFQLELAPGEYAVLAFDSIEGLEYMNPEVLRNYFSKAAHVTVRPEQKSSVTLDLIRRQE